MSKLMKKVVICLTVAAFLMSCGLALAAEKAAAKAEKQWFVLKDVKGRCSVRELKAATPKTIAGPYATKEAAHKAKDEKCPKTEKPEKGKTNPTPPKPKVP